MLLRRNIDPHTPNFGSIPNQDMININVPGAQLNTWQHVSFSFDNKTGRGYGCLNGRKVSESEVLNRNLHPDNNFDIQQNDHRDMEFGYKGDSNDCVFHGRVRDIRIYDLDLNEGQILNIVTPGGGSGTGSGTGDQTVGAGGGFHYFVRNTGVAVNGSITPGFLRDGTKLALAVAHTPQGDIIGKAIGNVCFYGLNGKEERTENFSFVVSHGGYKLEKLSAPPKGYLLHGKEGGNYYNAVIAHSDFGNIPGKEMGGVCIFTHNGVEHRTNDFSFLSI